MTMTNRYMVNRLIRSNLFHKWVTVLKNGPSKICGRQRLKKFTNFLKPVSHKFYLVHSLIP